MHSALILAAANSSGGSSLPLLLMVAVLGLGYFVFIRPRQAKARAAQAEAKQVEQGDWVRTIGGLEGEVVAASESHVVIRTGHVPGAARAEGPTSDLTFSKQALAGKIANPYEAPAIPEEAAPDADGGAAGDEDAD